MWWRVNLALGGLFALLLMLFGYTKPLDSLPLHPHCNSTVMEGFAKEAKELHSAMDACTDSCNLRENITVPKTGVNFNERDKMERDMQEAEIWRGLMLFMTAIPKVKEIITDSSLKNHTDKSYRHIRSLISFLKGLNGKGETMRTSDLAQATTYVQTMKDFFLYYFNFVRWKVKQYVKKVCQNTQR
ncbi:erythropoietin isoform X2 [Microcaecilia unicolor]|uniref:Erythropoietin n=1 Tax=Microcaecilia unicolor TaxID=1415580 RepID=A0A6P7WPV9_9AMPH|nr:erythropoietin isoform X2 [Microcaecilia unicolor]